MSVIKNIAREALTGANAALYTVPPAKSVGVRHITVVETGGNTATWYLYFVNSGGVASAGAENVFINGESLSANQRKEFSTWKVLPGDGVICGYKSGSGDVTVHIDGILIKSS